MDEEEGEEEEAAEWLCADCAALRRARPDATLDGVDYLRAVVAGGDLSIEEVRKKFFYPIFFFLYFILFRLFVLSPAFFPVIIYILAI